MKIERFNESQKFVPSNDEEMINLIDNIISDWVGLRNVEYTDGDYELDPKSVFKAANQIIQELKNIGVNFDLIYDIKKYNL